MENEITLTKNLSSLVGSMELDVTETSSGELVGVAQARFHVGSMTVEPATGGRLTMGGRANRSNKGRSRSGGGWC